MDLSLLNFKSILIILTDKEMRSKILALLEDHEVDVRVKFVDGYFQAATQITENPHDPFDHVVMNLSYNNQKLNDFVEFITPSTEKNPDFLIEYTREGDLCQVDIK